MDIEVFGNRLFVVFDDLKKSVGRIELPGDHSERTRKATVYKVGGLSRDYKIGDRILLSWYSGVRIHRLGESILGLDIEEDRFRVVREEEILAKITSE
jgi:co-chaperonin GroES (HSP10)